MQEAVSDPVKKFQALDAKQFATVERVLCETNLKFLCEGILGMKDWDKCHDELMLWDRSMAGRRYKLYLMPRGHLKTSIITIGKTIQDVLKDHETSILLASAVWDNARSFLSEIKEYLTLKSRLPQLYGSFESKRWNQDEVVIRQRSKPNKTPTIDTAGIEKTLTSQHYKVIRIDDPVTRENIGTQDQLEKVIKFFKDCVKLLEPDGVMEIVGTRWHDGDLYGHILRELT